MGRARDGSEPVNLANLSDWCSGCGHRERWGSWWSTGKSRVDNRVLESKGTKPKGRIQKKILVLFLLVLVNKINIFPSFIFMILHFSSLTRAV